ncbi:MAG: DMT family transporter [Rhodobacteraceae bacterium]|nr:DMT family transporter [Paracoccaceae bacterium]
MTRPDPRHLTLAALLVVLGAGWGMTQPLSKIAVSEGYRHIGLVFWQLTISAAILAVVCAIRREPLPLRADALGMYLLIGVIGTVIPNSAAYQAAVYLPSGVLSVVLSLVPMFAFPIALLLAIDRFSWRRLAGLLCGLSGVAFLALPGTSLPQAGLLVFLPLAMIAPLFYSLEGNIVAKWGTAGLSPVQLVLGANLIGMVIAAPLAVGTGQWVDPFPPYGAPDAAIVALAAIHALVYVSYVWLVGQAGAVFAAQVSYLVTGFGVFWAMLILGERYSGFFWAAMALMMSGLFLVQPRPGKSLVVRGPIRKSAVR